MTNSLRPFNSKVVLLGISGSIASYKVVDLASQLTQLGATVKVLMTKSSLAFISPLVFRSVTHHPVITDPFDHNSDEAVEHVSIAVSADIVVIAPATANTIAKLALGIADDPIGMVCLATNAPIVVAPAMESNMWEHQTVQRNIEALQSRGVTIIGPESGRLASGREGIGRLATNPEILGCISQILGRTGDLAGKKVVVTSGGTQEPLDPVRVLGNRSSGKMGHSIAVAARNRGAEVVLVSGPTGLPDPPGAHVIHVSTAEEMKVAVLESCSNACAVFMAAAVADYRPANVSKDKIKKNNQSSFRLDLTETTDIIAQVPTDVIRIGFAAETGNLVKEATKKLTKKNLDLIVANDITQPHSGFGSDTNKVSIINPQGEVEELPVMPKDEVAWILLDRLVKLVSDKGSL